MQEQVLFIQDIDLGKWVFTMWSNNSLRGEPSAFAAQGCFNDSLAFSGKSQMALASEFVLERLAAALALDPLVGCVDHDQVTSYHVLPPGFIPFAVATAHGAEIKLFIEWILENEVIEALVVRDIDNST